jgi:hypothetical protein
MTQQLINSDSSANEIIHKLCTSIQNFDISLSEAINDTLIAIDNSRNETLQRIKQMDNSTNQHIVNLISSIDQSNNVIIEKMQDILCSIHQSHDESMDNISDVMNNLNIKSNETQQKLQEYIGRYIVIPLFKQRIIDTSVTYYKMLEKRILCVIEDYLVYFKKGEFASLVVYYNTKKQIELASEVYDIKKEAFEKFLTFTPGATCFSDMDEDTVEQYKSFRKYISWAYKTLDGLIKSIEMWTRMNVLELTHLDSQILEEPELLESYLNTLALEEKKKFNLFETDNITLDIGGNRLNIKPKYAEYMNRYGWPEDGIFDAEKMAGIIKDLEAQGILEPPKPDICSSSGLSSNENTENTECTSNTETGETSNTETGETTNTEQETTENDSATSSAETQYTSAETQESSPETQESSDCGEKSSSEKSSSEKSSSEKSSSEKSSSDSNNNSANTDSESCKSKSDSSNKSSDTDVNSIVKSLSSCSTTSDVNSCTFSEDDLCNNELTNYTTAAYFVYVAIEDDFHLINTFYYPLFLSKSDAIDANDISSNTEVMSWTFAQHPGIIFWMPFSSKSSWGPNSISHPPLGFEYIHFTNCIGSSGIYYHPISRNKQPRSAFSFEIGYASVMKYMMESPVIVTEQLDPVSDFNLSIKIPWISHPNDATYNWNKLFSFTTDATDFNDLYANNKNLKFHSDKNQWFKDNLLTMNNDNLDTYNNTTNISTDYLKHISSNLFGNNLMWQVFTNIDDILLDLSNNTVNSDIIQKLEISDSCGQTGLRDNKVMPSTILSLLANNSQFGHDRIKKLMSDRDNDTNKKMYLLKEGDFLQFNITIVPSNNGIIDNMEERRITKKTYNICFVLLNSDPNVDYDLNNLQLAQVNIIGRFFPSNEIRVDSPMFNDENKTGIFTYQWLSDNIIIQGSNSENYILTNSDASKNISCEITYTNNNGDSVSTTTDSYYINKLPIPTIYGPLFEGFTLFANTYFLEGSLSYQWYRDDIPIDNATLSCYILKEEDISTNISVKVTTDFPFIDPMSSEPTTLIQINEDPVQPTNFETRFTHTNKILFSWVNNTSYPFTYNIEKIYNVTVGDTLNTPGVSNNHISQNKIQSINLPVTTKLNSDIDIVKIVVDDTLHFSTSVSEDEKNTWTDSLIKYIVFIEDSGFVKMMELNIEKYVVVTTCKLSLGQLKYISNPSDELLALCPSGQALTFDQINRTSFTKWSSSTLALLHNEWETAVTASSSDYALQSVTLKVYEDIISTNHNSFPYEIDNYDFTYVVKAKNNNNVISKRSNEIIIVSTTEKQLIDTWLSNNTDTLNRFGDPIDTVYTGGNPLFNEENELISDLYDYIKTQNPTNPWI